MTDEEIRVAALEFAKRNKSRIAKELTDQAKYAPDVVPVSVFMAGSPGAGKTEFSKILIELLEQNKEHRVIRIDGDEIRSQVPGYTGNNSKLFQGAISLIVERMHDNALQHKQSFVFDGTLSNYEKATKNIKRSLDKKRSVFIFYMYQKPNIAWKFTQAREKTEGRNIPKMAFIKQFFGAKEAVSKIFEEFGDKVEIYLVKRDFERNTNMVKIGGSTIKNIDDYIQESYTSDDLEKLL